MRTFLVLNCSLALACAASGQVTSTGGGGGGSKKEQAQSAQPAAAPAGGSQKRKGSQKVTTAGGRPAASEFHKTHQYSVQVGSTAGAGPQKAAGAGAQKTKGPQQIATQSGQAAGGHYIGLDHTLVNKSNVAKPPSGGTGKATTVGKPTTATERELMDKMGVATRNNSRAGMGKPTTMVGTFTPKMGKPAGGKKKGEKASPTPRQPGGDADLRVRVGAEPPIGAAPSASRGGKQKGQGDMMNSFQVIQKETGEKVSPTPRPQ